MERFGYVNTRSLKQRLASDKSRAFFPNVLMLLNTVLGTVHSVFKRTLPAEQCDAVCQQLLVMCLAYRKVVK
jgi:hypothetical protein